MSQEDMVVDGQGSSESEASTLRRYEVYLKERATLGEQQFRTSQAFDKAILTVSGRRIRADPDVDSVPWGRRHAVVQVACCGGH